MSTPRPMVARTRIGSPVFSGVVVRRIIWNVIPIALVVGALEMVLVGDDGLLERHHLKQRLYTTQTSVTQMEEVNVVLRSRIRALHSNPDAVRRVVGERLLSAPTGSTIYRFDKPLVAR